MERGKTIRSARLLSPLALGLALTLGLLWALMPRSAVEAQAVNSGFTVNPTHDAVWDQMAPGDTAAVAHARGGVSPASAPALAPPQDDRTPPDFAPPHGLRVPPDGPWAASGAPLFASAGDAAGPVPAAFPEAIIAGPNRPMGWGDWDSNRVAAPVVISDTGQFKMWYAGVDQSDYGRLGQATSFDGINWTKSASNPLLDGGEAMVLKEGPADHKMWFSQDDISIYRATSADGLAWTVYPTPVFEPTGLDGSWERDYTGDPSIVQDGGVTYWMFYEAANWDWDLAQIGVATSTNGIDWTRVQTTPVLAPGNPGDWDEFWVLDPMVIFDGGTFKMWYSAFDSNWTRHIGYATSTDGVNWIKYGGNPVFEPDPGQWDDGNVGNHFVYYGSDYEMWYTSNGRIGYVTSTNGVDWTRFLTGPVLTPGPSLFIYVNYAHDWVMADTLPFATVTITVADGGGIKATVTGQADGGGEFRSREWSWDPDYPDIAPGDAITASADGLTTTVNPVGTIEGVLDVDADTVYGTIHAPWFAPLTLTVRCMVWESPYPSVVVTGVAADGGSYVCDFSDKWDIQPGQSVAAMYFEPDGDWVINVFQAPWMRVCYGHDWVGGNYEAGHTFWITVTNGGGTVRATATMNTIPGGGWGGDGFQTDWPDWTPEQPDIEPDDWVHFQSDDGHSNAIHVGTITGTVDVDNDSVGGNVYATWFTQTLDIQCHPWGGPGDAPVKDSTAAPDGSSPYFCQWDPETEWDILPDQEVAVMYLEPDGDGVINVFQKSAPYLRIDKGADGNPGEGGNFVFNVFYRNEGDAHAENTVITDTMLGGITYITDTSGFPHTGTTGAPGDPIVWDLGAVEPGDWIEFDVFVQVTAAQSETITNAVQIATSNPYDQGDPWEKESTRSAHVQGNDTHLNVGKDAWTDDPVPGYDFVYSVNACNEGSTASSEVVLTDTLHPSTALQYWWGQSAVWTEVISSSNLLVVSRPSLDAWSCEEVYLRVHLADTAWPGMYITNTAVITANNDLEDDDNETYWEGGVGEPHTNLYINKQLEWGQLVTGGEIAYEIRYSNNGNVPVNNVLITDTLPVSTTFSRSWRWTEYGEPPVTPTVVTADYVVWDIGTLDNGYDDNIGVALEIDNDLSPSAVLTNTVEISPQPEEDRYDDNTSTWVETLHDHGPNLRVDKYYRWEGESQIFYGIFVRNLGTTPMENIWITDTYPVLTTWNGDFWMGHGPWFTYTHDAPNRQFIVWAEELGPGGTGHLGFWVDLDESIHGVQGLIFTNTVKAPWPGDVYPDDNDDIELAYTGPDLYVVKTAPSTEVEAGETLTFTLRYGNQAERGEDHTDWDGTVYITDTLPAGMEYITSTQRWCDGPDCPYITPDIVGDQLVFDVGALCHSCWNDIYLTVRITDTAQLGDAFANSATIASSSPTDVEPYYENNTSSATVTIRECKLCLPLVVKNF